MGVDLRLVKQRRAASSKITASPSIEPSAMRRLITLSALVAGIVVVLVAPVTALAQHDHPVAGPAATAPPAHPWPADATLSANMARIHDTLDRLRHYEMGHMDATLARDQADVIAESASEIFTKCKLPPERDAVLHGMLVPLLAATQKFKTDPADAAQIAAMREAVAAYPRYFEAPGWQASPAH